MNYSIIGILASIVLLISNRDILWNHEKEITVIEKNYRYFLWSVLAYYVTDMLWGILEANHFTAVLFLDTTLYFIAMAVAVLMWTRYVISYLDSKNRFEKALFHTGNIFFLFETVVVLINLFLPILFWFDESGAYHAGVLRYVTLAIQIIMFLLISAYTFYVSSQSEGKEKLRHRTIGWFGIAMTALIIVQVFYPLLPMYAIGYMLGTCLLHSFVVEDEKEENRRILEEALKREQLQKEELSKGRAALNEALAAAEHANRAKTTFLNNMSHDIRTPMNAIVGFTALAASHIDNKEQVLDYLDKIDVSSQHLLSLINDVLDMSRIESGKMTLEESEINLPDMIHDLKTIIQANVSAKQLELFIDTEDVEHEYIITDKLRLNQVFLNILSNAIKFTPSGGSISFRVIEKPVESPDATVFEFRIKDTGIGMSEEFQQTIFEAFTREKTSTVSGIQGTGLGMAITKSIVDMMGGTISVNSKLNQGSEFIVDIPCKIGATSGDIYTEIEELKGQRVLVVDDDVNNCLSLCSMLRKTGMRPDWTNYGREAVIRAKEAKDNGEPFAVYIIDWMMPDTNGIETIRRIRKTTGDHAPVILQTAYDWIDIESEAREAGVTSFCTKPIFLSELRNLLLAPYSKSKEEKEEEESYDFSGTHILLAEDNKMNQLIAEAILKEHGFTLDIVSDGDETVQIMKEKPAGNYACILMDIQMPKMDGYTAAKLIRQLEDTEKASIPIVAVTANAFDEDRRQALEAGMNGHLAKPYDVPKMMKTLKDLLK